MMEVREPTLRDVLLILGLLMVWIFAVLGLVYAISKLVSYVTR
jgi:hypothetical protein